MSDLRRCGTVSARRFKSQNLYAIKDEYTKLSQRKQHNEKVENVPTILSGALRGAKKKPEPFAQERIRASAKMKKK